MRDKASRIREILPGRLKLALSMLVGPPPFRFDHRLYKELVREKPDGSKLVAPGPEPDVDFEYGPIDGVLGRFDPKTGRIILDVLENFVACATDSDMTPADLKDKFDERLTRTAAHEGGHWQLQRRYGFWPILEKFVILGVLWALGVAAIFGMAVEFWHVLNSHLLPLLAGYGWAGRIIIGVPAYAVAFAIVRTVSHVLYKLAFAVSFGLTYQLCIHERYARRFEKRPETDPRWDGVVQV